MTSYNRRPERKKKAFRRRRRGVPCAYCGRLMKDTKDKSNLAATRDHVIPKALGGRKFVWACRGCNQAKKDMTPEQWRQHMREHPRWWK